MVLPEPVYWNTASGAVSVANLPAAPPEATHLLIVTDFPVIPQAVKDEYVFDEDVGGAFSVAAPGVLANDYVDGRVAESNEQNNFLALELRSGFPRGSSVDAVSLTASLVSGPAHGQVTVHPDGSFEYRPGNGFEGSDQFTYQAVDGARRSLPATVTVEAKATELPWHHPSRPLDVNNDGFVVPGDALVIINELNNRTKIDNFGRLPQFRPADTAYYYDVTGDGYCTAADALWIINYLNSVVSPEGEASALVGANTDSVLPRLTAPQSSAGQILRSAQASSVRSEEKPCQEPVLALPALSATAAPTSRQRPMAREESPLVSGAIEDILDELAADVIAAWNSLGDRCCAAAARLTMPERSHPSSASRG